MSLYAQSNHCGPQVAVSRNNHLPTFASNEASAVSNLVSLFVPEQVHFNSRMPVTQYTPHGRHMSSLHAPPYTYQHPNYGCRSTVQQVYSTQQDSTNKSNKAMYDGTYTGPSNTERKPYNQLGTHPANSSTTENTLRRMRSQMNMGQIAYNQYAQCSQAVPLMHPVVNIPELQMQGAIYPRSSPNMEFPSQLLQNTFPYNIQSIDSFQAKKIENLMKQQNQMIQNSHASTNSDDGTNTGYFKRKSSSYMVNPKRSRLSFDEQAKNHSDANAEGNQTTENRENLPFNLPVPYFKTFVHI